MARSVKDRETLEETLLLEEEEKAWFRAGGGGLPLLINPYYLALAARSEGIRRQAVPREAENRVLPVESGDPLDEASHSPLPRLIHRYRNRVALLVTDRCAMHCRHCFRRSFTGTGGRVVSAPEIEGAAAYLKEHPEVEEVLLTGGDPLTLEDSRLLDLIRSLRAAREGLIIRLATRMPAVLPERITPELAAALGEEFPLWVVTQFNHPDELTPQSRSALDLLRRRGLPLVNQTVLLKGVNDEADLLARLCEGLLAQGVKPYYLFQGDLAAGTSHFRCNLEKGWEIMRALRLRVSGLAMPAYAVDLPGGGGKIPLGEHYLIGKGPEGFRFRNPEGLERVYPDE